MNDYTLVQADSGHWYAIAPDESESPIHWSKTWVRAWIKAHKKAAQVLLQESTQ